MSSLMKNEHILHIYQRSRDNIEIYRCIHPDCTHYQKRSLIIGKRAECKCGTAFIIAAKDVKGGKQKGKLNLNCFKCSKSPKKLEILAQQEMAEGVMDEILKEEFEEKFALPEFNKKDDENKEEHHDKS